MNKNRRVERLSTRARPETASKSRRPGPGQGAPSFIRQVLPGGAGRFAFRCWKISSIILDALHLLGLSKSGRPASLRKPRPFLLRALQVDSRLFGRTAQQSGRGAVRHGAIREGAGELREGDCASPELSGRDQQSRQCLSPELNADDRATPDLRSSLERSSRTHVGCGVYNRGNALLFLPVAYNEALQTFERVIREKPLYALAYNGRGLAWLEQGSVSRKR